jgi:D-glycero-D-manno-heptose 1,7-bisphosphate phosphatase
MMLPVADMEVNKAVFLDKDGTLIRDIPYNVNPDLITLSENSVAGLKNLMAAGYQLIVVSNQSGVAMGFFDYDELFLAERKIRDLLASSGVELLAFYYCPHHPQGVIEAYRKTCKCRKPASGMFKSAAETYQIDLSSSWMIGDILDDIEAGNMAGCKTALINNGNETEWKINKRRIPDCIVADINAAADYILAVSAHQHKILL